MKWNVFISTGRFVALKVPVSNAFGVYQYTFDFPCIFLAIKLAMINTKVLTVFLGKVCQDGVEQALLVDERGSVLGVGAADGFDSSVSKFCSNA